MTDELRQRLQIMKTILEQPGSTSEKLISVLQTLSGLNLSALTAGTRSTLEGHLAKVNRILQRYAIETWDDYAQISKAHRRRALLHMDQLCQTLL